uniref:BZIP domain-containing protein n=1 Tax=Tetranychus urticae TaxID=32264 RepID=T1JS47_TETUR
MNHFPFGFKFSAPTPPESPRHFVDAPLDLTSSSNSPSPPTLMLSLPSCSYQVPSLPSCSYQMPSTSFSHSSPSTSNPKKNKKFDDFEEIATPTKRTKKNIIINQTDSNQSAPSPTPSCVSSVSSTKKRTKVPDELKDEAYRLKRDKNNIAAKKSRDARRAREEETQVKADTLERIVLILKTENEMLRREVEQLKGQLFFNVPFTFVLLDTFLSNKLWTIGYSHQAGVGAIFDRVLTELVAKMRELKMDKTELGCLRSIVLFNPEAKHLKSISQIELLREKVYAVFEDYCKSTYPEQVLAIEH